MMAKIKFYDKELYHDVFKILIKVLPNPDEFKKIATSQHSLTNEVIDRTHSIALLLDLHAKN